MDFKNCKVYQGAARRHAACVLSSTPSRQPARTNSSSRTTSGTGRQQRTTSRDPPQSRRPSPAGNQPSAPTQPLDTGHVTPAASLSGAQQTAGQSSPAQIIAPAPDPFPPLYSVTPDMRRKFTPRHLLPPSAASGPGHDNAALPAPTAGPAPDQHLTATSSAVPQHQNRANFNSTSTPSYAGVTADLPRSDTMFCCA